MKKTHKYTAFVKMGGTHQGQIGEYEIIAISLKEAKIQAGLRFVSERIVKVK